MAEEIDFASRQWGSFLENEEDWSLIIGDDGSLRVRHHTSHADPYGRGKNQADSRSYTVEDFFASCRNAEVKDRLSKLLAERGLS